jgi:hypothetical protein
VGGDLRCAGGHVDPGVRVAGPDRHVAAVLHDVGEDALESGRKQCLLLRLDNREATDRDAGESGKGEYQ